MCAIGTSAIRPMPDNTDLFRQEVIEERKNRLHGEVVLKQTVTTRMMVVALVVVITIAGLRVYKMHSTRELECFCWYDFGEKVGRQFGRLIYS